VGSGLRKLKIAFVLDRYLPSRGGEGYFSWLANELSKRGHDVHVFATAVEDTPGRQYELHRVSVLGYPRSLRIFSFLANVARAIEPYGFDIVHGVGQTLSMNIFNPHGGVEKAYLARDFSSITSPVYYVYKVLRRYLSPTHYVMAWVQKRQYASRAVRKIIAISDMVKSDIIRYYRVPEDKIAVVFNCVDLDRFHPKNRTVFREAKRAELKIDGNTLVLLFAGNNYRLKGLEPLLRSLVYLRQWFPDKPFQLLIIGRSRIDPFLRMSRRLGISDQTRFLGSVKAMEQYYAASDIYVQPSFYDSCSLTVLEALAAGLPVVTSRFNGAADAILSDKGGRIVKDPANEEALARAIAFFFDDAHRSEARVVARKWIEKYPPSYNVEKMLQVYYEVAIDGPG
jgi:UDP-glucose:(heptosyl)LPS alpha-1,3-glucosyltransferase